MDTTLFSLRLVSQTHTFSISQFLLLINLQEVSANFVSNLATITTIIVKDLMICLHSHQILFTYFYYSLGSKFPCRRPSQIPVLCHCGFSHFSIVTFHYVNFVCFSFSFFCRNIINFLLLEPTPSQGIATIYIQFFNFFCLVCFSSFSLLWVTTFLQVLQSLL